MARFLLAVAFAVALAGAPRAEQATRAPDVDVFVPVPPYEHERLHFFDGRHHHLVPGTVTIDREPYQCDRDRKRFSSEDDFVAHLRGTHHVPSSAIPDALVVRDGIVHFVGN
jgi:hypothetical protein